jgi:hypothetical protein
MQPHSFSKRQLAATVALRLDEEVKNAALSDKKKCMWVHKCFSSRKSERSYERNSNGSIFAHSELRKYLESHLGIPEVKQLTGTLCLAPHVVVGDVAFPLKTYLLKPYPRSQSKRDNEKASSIICFPDPREWWKMYLEY